MGVDSSTVSPGGQKMELCVQNLSKNYKEKKALQNVSFTLTPGVYGLLGPNGAGKSTLIHILTCLLEPSGGEVLCDGREIRMMGAEYRARLGYVPQQQTLYPSFRAVQYLAYMAALKGVSREDAQQQIDRILRQVGLSAEGQRKIRTFSGGMKQRLLIAQAVLGTPQLLILDEPSAGLDPKQRIAIRQLIAEMAEEKIVLVATHIVSDVESIAKELILIKDGCLLAKDSVSFLKEFVGCQMQKPQVNLEDIYMYYFEKE